jgi:Leucine-rich repeat (LRR) protein
MLTFSVEKCINKLPESIGECSSLSFLNVTNNKDLKTLPESLINCACLEFISVEGSSDLKIENVPENLAKYLRVGDLLWEPDFPDEIRDKCESGGLAF